MQAESQQLRLHPEPDWRELHGYWFGSIEDSQAYMDGRLPIWFFADAQADATISARFLPWLEAAASAGELDTLEALLPSWFEGPRALLSLVLLFDQVPRNAFRGQAQAFAYDGLGLQIAERLFAEGHADALAPIERFFAELPFQHREELGHQRRQRAAIEALAARAPAGHQRFFGVAVDMAQRHEQAIERFGRFPHRNVILGRTSAAAELRFLEDPRNHF